MSSFTEKILTYTFSMPGGGNFTHTGLRSSCEIVGAGGSSMGQATITIYGLTLSDMNALTTFGTQALLVSKNSIRVEAGDQNGMSKIFGGTIAAAFVDASSMPEVAFRLTAFAGLYGAVQKSEPTSVPGNGDVATIAGQLAEKMGLTFENNNVNVKLSNVYLPSNYQEQMSQLAEHADIQWTIDDGVLAIWPSGKSRQTVSGSNLLSKDTGMVGYPAFGPGIVIVTTIFNPSLKYGGTFVVQSELTPANGTWNITYVSHRLESKTQHGQWFTEVNGVSEQLAGQSAGTGTN